MKFDIGHDILPHEYKGTVYNNDCVGRLRFLRGAFIFVFSVFILRTVQLGLQSTVIQHNGVKGGEIERRADIIDRNGVVLAKSVKSGNIKLYPPRVKEK